MRKNIFYITIFLIIIIIIIFLFFKYPQSINNILFNGNFNTTITQGAKVTPKKVLITYPTPIVNPYIPTSVTPQIYPPLPKSIEITEEDLKQKYFLPPKISPRIIVPSGNPSFFEYTGEVQEYIVPYNVYNIKIEAWGAASPDYEIDGKKIIGGKGGKITASVKVTPLSTLYVYVGGKGTIGRNFVNYGGWNGGGNGVGGNTNVLNGSGGGASDVRTSKSVSDRLISAGGGGGIYYAFTEYSNTKNKGGDAGGSIGRGGSDGDKTGGKGGTDGREGSGGSHPIYSSYTAPSGNKEKGGSGNNYGGGGGGGGWFGGGGGYGGGGGGGSSWSIGTILENTPGTNSGDGKITISY